MDIPRISTKIVATLGPATTPPKILSRILNEGVNVIRFNFSHGSHDIHEKGFKAVRSFSKKLDWPVGILQDLPGPKVRIEKFHEEFLDAKKGDTVILVPPQKNLPKGRIPVEYPRLAKDLKPGEEVYISDGLIQLKVHKIKNGEVHCRALNSGRIKPRQGVNMPHSNLKLKAFTKADEKHLAFGIKHQVDFVGISFVGDASDIKRVRAFCQKRKANPFLIAKIERRLSLKNLDSILDETDGIMVARGDLGVEIPFSEIPTLQEEIVSKAHAKGKPVILATQVLESMIQNPRPTRAEATDIANAIREGSDAVMLSGETSVGQFPLNAVKALKQVIAATERGKLAERSLYPEESLSFSELMAKGTWAIAEKMKAKFIVVPSRSGVTAARISKYRPSMPVLALVNDIHLRRKLSLFHSVQTLPINVPLRFDNTHKLIRQILLKYKLVKKNDYVLMVSGGPGVDVGQTGMIQVVKI